MNRDKQPQDSQQAEVVAPSSDAAALPKTKLLHLATLVLLLLLAYLSYQGHMSRLLQLLGGSHLAAVNQTYLATASDSASELLELLSAAKVALAVLKSSQGGISFFIDIEVQLGQALNVVCEMVDHAWLFSLSSLAAIKTMALVLTLSQLFLPVMLTLLCCLAGISLGLKEYLPRVAALFAEAGQLTLFLVLLLYLLLPLAIYASAAAGQHFFQPHKVELHQGFASALAAVPSHDAEHGLHSQVESSVAGLKSRQTQLQQVSSHLAGLTISHITAVIGEFLLLPLLVLLLLLFALRRLWQRLLTDNSEQLAVRRNTADPQL